MFSIARYDPAQQAAETKKDRLASFNDRLKRKRTHKSEIAVSDIGPLSPRQPEEKAVDHSPAGTLQDVQVPEMLEVSAGPKKPHREKRKKLRTSMEIVEDDVPSAAKTAHIIKKFHKIHDRAQQAGTQAEAEPESVQVEAAEPVADLIPVPQPFKHVQKRSNVAPNAGLPRYLLHPTIVATDLSRPFKDLTLCTKIQDNLAKGEFEDAFAVQAALLPVLLAKHLPENRQDVLVSAPTGSGKTLAYVLPILQVLQTRRITRLRALIIVPTRELVHQVQTTFEGLSSKLGLKIETLSATRSFATEQRLLVNDYEEFAPSNVDILICTPGRLVDHLKSTPRFTLRDLRFLVIDEGDRLLNQSFQGWSKEIDEALKPLRPEQDATIDYFQIKSLERCQKLIFSATMSTDPSLLAQLHLINPILFLVQDASEITTNEDMVSHFTMPSTLSEFFIHSPQEVEKPLVLLTLIKRMQIDKALIFTNSNESAQKLATLLALLQVGRVEAFTSVLSPAIRRRHLAAFSAPSTEGISFLICSDLMARGIDITVDCVVNYDSSISIRQYVHRAGRTARAKKQGRAISIVESHEDKYWWKQIGGRKVNRARAIKRVTLFPKKTHKIEENSNVEHQIRSNSDDDDDFDQSEDMDDNASDPSRDGESSDDSGLGDDEGDEEEEENEAVRTRKSQAVLQGFESGQSQMELAAVDQDSLRQLYEQALESLRSRS